MLLQRPLWMVLCLLPAFALVAHSQTGTILGSALDASGGVVTSAEIHLRQVETDRVSITKAAGDGSFIFPAVVPGEYELSAQAADLVSAARLVQLNVGRRIAVNLTLAPERLLTHVNVEATVPAIDTGNASVGSVIPRERLAHLPLNQREFLPLALLSGGTHSNASGSELSTQNNSGLHVNGAREVSNNFLLDGVDNNDLYINRLVVSPPLDSVREFRLHASSYQAEFGRSAGAQVNVVSRSGSNDLHGSIYEYVRNDNFDARNFFDPSGQPIPPFRRNQFGVSVGGPIDHQKTFFFGGYEGTRIKDAATRTTSVPTAAMREGDFSAVPSPVIDIFTQAPFQNNTIPIERQSSIGRNLASNWPDANRADPLQNFVSTPLGDGLVNQLYGRLDHYIGDSDALMFRYNLSHTRSLEPFGDDSDVPGFGNFTLDRGQNLAASNTHVFTPFTILETRFGFNRLRREVLHQNAGNDIGGNLGIPGLSTDSRFTGFPAINVAGFSNLADDVALPIVREDNTYHLVANMTHVDQRHAYKWGFEYRKVTIDGIQGLFGRGQFNFLGALSQNSVGDLLLGWPTFTIQTSVDNPFRQRAGFWSGYVQDDWKVTSRLTLNLGLRYEFNSPAVDADDRFMQFDLAARQLVPAATTSLGRAGYQSDRNNFAPRVGLSWNPNDSLVVRAGYGIYHEVNVIEANSGLYFNPPFFDLRIFFPSQTQLLSLDNPFPGAGFTPPASVNAIQPDFRTGYAQHFNAGVEKALGGGVVARASYLGSKGSKLLRRRDLNQPAPAGGDVNSRRPIAGFANVVMFESAASSVYHSGVFSLERRFAAGLGFSGAYTWSKSIDDVSAFLGSRGDQAFPQNSNDFQAERGLSNFDQRGRLVFTTTYDLPFRNVLARNWRLLAIGTFGSGRPFTPVLSVDNSNTGNTGSIFGADRPNVVGDPSAGNSSPERFFNTTAFETPAPETFGAAGRNILTGPGFATFDLAVVRTLRIADRATVDVRAEAFNLSNHTNLDLPERFSDQPTFGRIQAAGASRQIQLGLRISF